MKSEKSFTVDDPSEIPNVEHWAIFEGSSYSYDGGHGYGTISGKFCTYTAYLDEAAWRKEIQQRMDYQISHSFMSRTFRAAHIMPAVIETTITVKTSWKPPVPGMR